MMNRAQRQRLRSGFAAKLNPKMKYNERKERAQDIVPFDSRGNAYGVRIGGSYVRLNSPKILSTLRLRPEGGTG